MAISRWLCVVDSNHVYDYSDNGAEMTSKEQEKIQQIQLKINTLYDKIAHGDEEHRKWLKEAINEHFRIVNEE